MDSRTKKSELARLLELLRQGSDADKFEALRQIGLIDSSGSVTDRYSNWDPREVSRAADPIGADSGGLTNPETEVPHLGRR